MDCERDRALFKEIDFLKILLFPSFLAVKFSSIVGNIEHVLYFGKSMQLPSLDQHLIQLEGGPHLQMEYMHNDAEDG